MFGSLLCSWCSAFSKHAYVSQLTAWPLVLLLAVFSVSLTYRDRDSSQLQAQQFHFHSFVHVMGLHVKSIR